MNELNVLLSELGISKVKLSKYLGISRQMLYNYLSSDDWSKWPKEKATKLLELLDTDNFENIKSIKIDAEYTSGVEARLNQVIRKNNPKEIFSDLKGLSKKQQDLITNIITIMKDNLEKENSQETYETYVYLYYYIQSMEVMPTLKYILAYVSKSLCFTDPLEFIYSKDKQYIFESILYSAMNLYNTGGASKSKLTVLHKRFEEYISQKKEEKLSRTEELNTNKIQALKELGYSEINEENAAEVLDKMAEIEARQV